MTATLSSKTEAVTIGIGMTVTDISDEQSLVVFNDCYQIVMMTRIPDLIGIASC